MLSIRVSCYDGRMRRRPPITQMMRDPWGESTRQSFDERCRFA
jgi:hypothetical protein